MIDNPAAAEVPEEVLDLVDGDGVAHADVDSPTLLERTAAVDADQLAGGVEQGAAGVAGVDRSVGLDAVGVFQQRPRRVLVAVDAGNKPVGDGRLKIGRQQERIADGEAPVTDTQLVAVAQFRGGEILAAQQFDQGHVAGRVQTDDHGVVQLPIGHAALHVITGRLGDVKVGQRIAVGRDHDARSAALAFVGKDGDGRSDRLGHGGDPLLFGLQDGVGNLVGDEPGASQLRMRRGRAA